ncbi:MAG TPA: DUF6298 domain-containing protein [Tepidisphaeraceae bacterium]|jgi:hypothetical protein
MTRSLIAAFGLVALASAVAIAQTRPAANRPPPPQPTIAAGPNGTIVYKIDSRGNRVPDFSTAGYRGGDAAIPDVPVRVTVEPAAGDNTARIQAAIDYVSSLPADQRGAILLGKGRFEINGGLKIAASGVVLRGSGARDGGTVLVAAGHDRRNLITIGGRDDFNYSGDAINVADGYVPVGATKLILANTSGLKVGSEIAITRPCTPAWIDAVGMNVIGGDQSMGTRWKPGTRVLNWYRTITAIDGNTITIDAPLTTALEEKFGGGTVRAFTWPGRVTGAGVENLRCESAYDQANPKDEAHSWFAVVMDNVRDSWVRQITFLHFAGSAVTLLDNTQRITVEDCKSLAPVSEIAGYRRHTFITYGQQALFQRCYSEHGRHDFAVGYYSTGPTAFVQCEAVGALDDSGPIDSWASGVLYDCVRMDGNGISLMNRGHQFQFAGWSAANSMLWQCNAPLLTCQSPPTAINWAIGCWGKYEGNGQWEQCDEFVRPTSLFYGQLAARLGPEVAQKRSDWMMVPNDGASNPPRGQDPVKWATAFIKAAEKPAPRLTDWIEDASSRHPIPIDAGEAKTYEQLGLSVQRSEPVATRPISIKDGALLVDGQRITGNGRVVKWWQGGVRPEDVMKQDCLTRFVPGRIGPGYTDDLSQIAASMVASGTRSMEHHYGLWYDRRNDDHERVRRMDGDAWPPFFEMPFARSGGNEVAWDGLSKYDLTKFNPWYWDRLKEFADLCDRNGLVLFNNHFFQHNILEAGAHWASCPWRTVNNVNNMGFPEPPPYAGDKRIFMAEQFYDITNATRREIYRGLIRKNLENFAGNTNVVHLIGAEFTGPIHFTQFWLDTIGEWEKETGKHPMIALAVPKNVQDAILADPARAAVVDVIFIRPDLYEVPGGANLSPRQWSRVNPLTPIPEQTIRELKEKFPAKAVIGGGRGGQVNAAD